MTLNVSNQEPQPGSKPAQAIPAFKPVALPALAAAMRSAQRQPGQPKATQPPAILRKEAVLDR